MTTKNPFTVNNKSFDFDLDAGKYKFTSSDSKTRFACIFEKLPPMIIKPSKWKRVKIQAPCKVIIHRQDKESFWQVEPCSSNDSLDLTPVEVPIHDIERNQSINEQIRQAVLAMRDEMDSALMTDAEQALEELQDIEDFDNDEDSGDFPRTPYEMDDEVIYLPDGDTDADSGNGTQQGTGRESDTDGSSSDTAKGMEDMENKGNPDP